jgi:hypothetical protein
VGIINGQGITNGATHFQNPRIVEARANAGTGKRSNVNFGGMPVTAEIGDHRFYAANGGSAAKKAMPVVAKSEDDFFGEYDSSMLGESN